jgi:hypothetical protein
MSVLLIHLLPIFPKFWIHQIVINITVSSPEDPTGMPSPINQYVINLVVSLVIRRGPGIVTYVSVREHPTLKKLGLLK